jgi:hypothetical protein
MYTLYDDDDDNYYKYRDYYNAGDFQERTEVGIILFSEAAQSLANILLPKTGEILSSEQLISASTRVTAPSRI